MPCNDEKKDDKKQDGMMDRMLKARTILISGQIDEEAAEKAIGQLVILEMESHDPIKIIITSPGGHVDAGFAIHDMLKFGKSDIISIGAGCVASIAVPIFLGAKKESRYSLPNTRYLLHQPSGGAGGQIADIRIEAQEIIKIRTKINHMIANETGQSVERIKDDSDRNFWMSAQEAKEYGLVTKIISSVDEIA